MDIANIFTFIYQYSKTYSGPLSLLGPLCLFYTGPVKTVVVDPWLLGQRKGDAELFLAGPTHVQPIIESPWIDQGGIYLRQSCGPGVQGLRILGLYS